MTETSPLTNRSPIVSDPVTVPPQPSVRGESLLRRCENVWLHLDRLAARFLPSALNPFGQLGAIANTCLLAVVVSGRQRASFDNKRRATAGATSVETLEPIP